MKKIEEPRRYAEGTDVSAERSRAELETMLRKHGATEFGTYATEKETIFQCRIKGVMLRNVIQFPTAGDIQRGPRDKPADVERKREAELRRRWRALVLVTKAKLEIVASGGSSIEREFMAELLLPNGQTLGEAFIPRLADVYTKGTMPSFTKLLLGPGKE